MSSGHKELLATSSSAKPPAHLETVWRSPLGNHVEEHPYSYVALGAHLPSTALSNCSCSRSMMGSSVALPLTPMNSSSGGAAAVRRSSVRWLYSSSTSVMKRRA